MAETLIVYKGSDVIGTGERGQDGKANVTISNLEANTDYPTGTYTVAFSDGSKESEKVDVPAFKTKPIAVTGVTLDETTISLEVGASKVLTATVAPSTATNKTVTFSSEDEAIATVTNAGKVTGIGSGNVGIIATTKDGNKTARCFVLVEEPDLPSEPEIPEEPEEPEEPIEDKA